MSDYLGHLVERSLAPITVLRPNIPSRFGSSPAGPAIDAENVAPSPHHTEPVQGSASQPPNEAVETTHNATGPLTTDPLSGFDEKFSSQINPSVSPLVAVSIPLQNSSLAPSHAGNPGRSNAVLPRLRQPVDPATASSRGVNGESHFSPAIRPKTASTPGLPRLDRTRSVSSTVRKENGPSPSHDASTPPSAIHVTIGRIEIKATPPTPPAPSRATPRKNPAMSLEKYLQRRSNGGRDE